MNPETLLLEDETVLSMIEYLYKHKRFLPIDHPSLQQRHQQQILHSLNINEFYEECQLDRSLPYNEAVKGYGKHACFYALYAIRHNQPYGKMNLKHIQVAQGFVGYSPHSWLVMDDEYIIDLTLAQYTNIIIPRVAVLRMDDAKYLYKETSRHNWIEWTEIGAEQKEIPV